MAPEDEVVTCEALVRAAATLAATLRMKIDGLPDHPWIPGARFADGRIMKALEDLEKAL